MGKPDSSAPPLDPALVTGLGFSLSVYDMHGNDNPRFGDGSPQFSFKLVVERVDA